MNTELVKQEINKIVETYRNNDRKGGRQQYPASKKYIARAEELGILEFIPNAPGEKNIGNTEIQLILKEAEDGGHVVGGWTADGDGDVVTTRASALYNAIHEVEIIEEITRFEVEFTSHNNFSIEIKDANYNRVDSIGNLTTLRLWLSAGEYVKVATDQNTGQSNETRFTVASDGKVTYESKGLPLSELI